VARVVTPEVITGGHLLELMTSNVELVITEIKIYGTNPVSFSMNTTPAPHLPPPYVVP